MRITLPVALTFSLLTFTARADAPAADPAPTPEDVLAMIARAPASEAGPGRKLPGHWEKQAGAMAAAEAIAKAVATDESTVLLGTRRLSAAGMATYAIYESALQKCARGDGGKALGIFQLQGFPESIACDADVAAGWWLRKAHASQDFCESNVADEKLALLASGSCGRGRRLAARRMGIAREIAGP